MEQDEKLQKPISDEPLSQPQADDSTQPSLWSTVSTAALLFVFVAGVVVLIVWASLRPSITVYVESASLTSFNLSSNNTLHHSLSVELSMRNPSRSDSAYYRRVETSAYYDGIWFQWAALDDFYMGHKSTTMLRTVMAGATPVEPGAWTVLYSKQRKVGAFDLEVRLQAKVRYRVWTRKSSKSRTRRVRYKCFLPGLRLRTTGGFVRTKCKTY